MYGESSVPELTIDPINTLSELDFGNIFFFLFEVEKTKEGKIF